MLKKSQIDDRGVFKPFEAPIEEVDDVVTFGAQRRNRMSRYAHVG